MELDFSEIRELLTLLSQTDISEVSLKSESFELTVRKSVPVSDRPSLAEAVGSLPAAIPASPVPVPVTPSAVAAPPASAPLINDRLVDITSPMVGTFYRAPAPDEPPFVRVGDRIRSGQTVCIIEAMKLMNEIEAEVVGEIVEILVENAEPVEYGQVLMRVNPN